MFATKAARVLAVAVAVAAAAVTMMTIMAAAVARVARVVAKAFLDDSAVLLTCARAERFIDAGHRVEQH